MHNEQKSGRFLSRIAILCTIALMLQPKPARAETRHLVVHRGEERLEFDFELEKLNPARTVNLNLVSGQPLPNSGFELMDQFFSSVKRGDLAWYRSLWELESLGRIDPNDLADFGQWGSLLTGRSVIVEAVVRTQELELFSFTFAGDPLPGGVTVKGNVVTARGGPARVTDQFVDNYVVQFWDDADLDVIVPVR